MAWQPGQSGNPNRVRKTKGERLSDLASNYTLSAVNTIAGIMENPQCKPADRLTAARLILDRAVGLPTQAVEVSGSIGLSLVELLATLPGQARPATIEHDAPPPRLPASFSLVDAAQAAEELEEGRAGDAGQADELEDADTCTLVLQPANGDPGGTQPGGE